MTATRGARSLLVLLVGALALVLVLPLGAAVAAGDPTPTPTPPAEPVAGLITLAGPASLVDETTGTLQATWRSRAGMPVPGRARLWQRVPRGTWTPAQAVVFDLAGRASVTIRPRTDTWFQLRGEAGLAWTATTSPVLYVDNLPPARPVVLPAGAPRPKSLPAQPRATLPGSAVVLTRIPDAVWKRMVGRSWRKGCPVGRGDLRYLQTNYWGFDGYRHRGELVVRASAADQFAGAVRRLYERRVPIRSMYLVDRFGYSGRSRGADDFASMRHDNTSAFNCRGVTGRKEVRSPHSYGRSLDLNPWENPFHSAVGWVPNRWWATRSDPRYAWRSGNHLVVRIMRAHGFRWSYPRSDPQHFDAY